MAVFVNKEAARNMAINSAPMASILGRKLAATASTNIGQYFSPFPQLAPPPTTNLKVAQLGGTDNVVARNNEVAQDPNKSDKKTPSIRQVMDDTLGAMNLDEEFKWLEKTKYTMAMTLAIDLIVSQFEHRKSSKTEDPLPTPSNSLEAMKRYKT